MSVDFFKEQCINKTSNEEFGICDEGDINPAYLKFKDNDTWIATVLNNNGKEVTFIAIDNCIDFPLVNGEMPSRCDAMLICDNCLYIVELKNKRSDWQESGIDQLEATVKHMIKEIKQFDNYRFRKAYVANRRHPHFHVIENEKMDKFWDLYKVRLDIQATIRII